PSGCARAPPRSRADCQRPSRTYSMTANRRSYVAASRGELDDERDARVEPVAVQPLDPLTRGAAAEVEVALQVVEPVDGPAIDLPRPLLLALVGHLPCDAGRRPNPDSQAPSRARAA